MVLQTLLGNKRVDEVRRRRCYTSIPCQGCKGRTGSLSERWILFIGILPLQVVERIKASEIQRQKIRELREELKRYQRVEKRQGAQCEPACEEGKLEEDGQMEVGGETESKKNLDERKKKLQKPLRDIEKFTDMDQLFC